MITDYITLECLALQLALPKAYLRRLVDAGKLPYIDTGNGRLRFQERAVRQALDKLAEQGTEINTKYVEKIVPETGSKND